MLSLRPPESHLLGLIAAALWLAFGALASAHQPFQSSIVVRFQHERLEVTITMSEEMGTRLSGGRGEIEGAAFEDYQARLQARAGELFQLFAGDDLLTPERTVVRRNSHGDAECVLIFAEPQKWPLRMRGEYLRRLPAGYQAGLEVLDENENGMGARMLTREVADLVVNAAPAAPLPPPVAESPAPPAKHSANVWAYLIAAFALMAVVFRQTRKFAAPALMMMLVAQPAFAQRQMENLGRGMIVLRSSSTQTYIGWRMLGTDPDDIAFNLYRSANGGAAVKLNATPITASTNYSDTPASLSTTAYSYFVKPVINGVEGAASAAASLPVNAPVRQYIPVPLQPTPDGALDVKFCWVGDLDGDGEYDFVVDRQPATEARQFLEAYKRDGTLLWRMDMGPNSVNHYNIEPGSSAISIGHGDNVTVYDLDGDGLAEVIVRTGNGVVFGNGATVTAADNNVQFLSIVNGMTGAEMARATIPNPILSDGPMNGHMAIFYPDGQRPSVLLEAKNRAADLSFHGAVTSWDYRGGVLSQRWTWNNLGALHAPEGHQIRIGDVDNDGKDELIDIGYVLDDNGTQLFNLPEVIHGDRFHMTDMDPDRPGLEMFIIQQNNASGLATAYFDPGTGRILKKWYAGAVVDVGRGVVADMDPNFKGCEFFSTQPGIFDAKGNQIYAPKPFPPEAIWWDADLSREFVATVGSTAESPAISKFNPADPGNFSRIYTIYNETAPGVYQAYGGRPQFWGDILGDWREELLCVANDNSELRIYIAKTVATNRLYTLMHNPQYRCQATTKGYVQASYVDYYLGTGMTPPPPPPMVDAALRWRGGAGATTWDVGATASWTNGANSTFANGDSVLFEIGANNTTTVALNGVLQPGAVTFYSPKNHVVDGSAGSLAGSMKLVKAGAGAVTISGNHGFTGKTTVWDGALLVNGDFQQSPVTVWGGTWGGALSAGLKGGRIGGVGRFSQAVAVKYRGAIVPGSGMGNAGTVTFGSGLTMDDGSVCALDLSDDPTGATKANDRIAITGNLVVSGKVAIVINPLNAQLAPGTYTLVTYTGALTGNLSNFAVTVPVGTPYTLAAGAGAITLTVPVTRAAASVSWRGSGGAWDLAASANWLRGGAPDVFVSGDSVLFDATGAASPTVTLLQATPVASLSVNSATDYTITGAGYITGPTGLTKSGAGTLTVNTLNDFTGPTIVNGGVLAVSALGDAGAPSAIGAASASAGNFVLNGGTLRLVGPQTSTNRSFTLGAAGGVFDIATAGSSIQISGVATGSGALTKTGPGTLLLAAANTFTGGTLISQGTVYLAGSTPNESGLGTGAVTLAGGTLTMADVQNNDVATWNLIVPAGQIGRLNADGRCSLRGTLTGGGDFTYFTGYVRTDLAGNWSSFTGRIFAVTDSDGGDFRITHTAGFPNALVDLGDQIYAYYNTTPPSTGQTIDIGALSGVATAQLRGGPTGGRTVTYRIGGKNLNTVFAGTIANSAGATAITKLGTGALTLGGACTYTGATTVSAGSLLVTGSLAGSNVTVQNGGTLGGSGTITGNVNVLAGGRLAFLANGGVISGLNITGNLSLAGTIAITPGAGSGTFAAGTYTVATYSGTLTGAYNLAWIPGPGSSQSATFDTSTAGVIKMTVSSNAPVLTWTGAVNSAWDTATANWLAGGASAVFAGANAVIFPDGATTSTVAIAGPLSPESVAFTNATASYAVSGTGGGLAGVASITKTGAGKVTFFSANSHIGLTTISGGILALGADGSTTAATVQHPGLTGGTTASLGTGGVLVNSGGQLRFGGRGGSTVYTFTTANPIALDGGTIVSYDGSQQLTGDIEVRAGGAAFITVFNQKNLLLAGEITGSGNVAIDDINAGGTDTSRARVRVSAAGNPFDGTITINAASTGFHGGRLAIENDTALINATIIDNNNAVPALLFTTTAVEIGALGGSANFALPTTSLTVGGNGASTVFSGAMSGSAAFVKVGGGTLTLSGANTFTGATTIAGGRLALSGSLASPATATTGTLAPQGTPTISGNVAVNSGGTFQVRLNGPAVGTAYDQLTVSGGVTLAGTLEIIAAPGLAAGTTFTIVNKTSAGAVSGAFAGMQAGSPFAASGYQWLINYAGGDGNDVTLTIATAQQVWRFQQFGTIANAGNAADAADGNGDGESNFVEFCTGQIPTAATRATSGVVKNGVALELTYTRALAAVSDGVVFTVEWRDELGSGAWSSAGLSETILSDNGVVQSVRASVAAGSAGRRFLRVKMAKP